MKLKQFVENLNKLIILQEKNNYGIRGFEIEQEQST